jgi:hypothetical protein
MLMLCTQNAVCMPPTDLGMARHQSRCHTGMLHHDVTSLLIEACCNHGKNGALGRFFVPHGLPGGETFRTFRSSGATFKVTLLSQVRLAVEN